MSKISILFLAALTFNCSNKVDTNLSDTYVKNNGMYNFGEIYFGDTLRHVFAVENRGNSLLNIENVQSGCSCTTSRVSNTVIKPDSHSEVEIDFIPNKEDIGIVNKLVVVKTNGKKKIILLHIVGKVLIRQ